MLLIIDKFKCQLVFTEDVFTVGNDITLSLEVRPRSLTGVLLAVHADNDGDFLLLQMVNGEVNNSCHKLKKK